MQYYLSLLGFAAIDSVNLLAFAVIAGLWLTSAGRGVPFAPRAARFTGGAFCGIVLLSLISVWVIGNNQEFVRGLFYNLWAMVALGVVGLVITVLGLRRPAEAKEDSVEAPLTQNVLQKFGIMATGVALGVIQSGTSAPFAAGMVLISFAESPWWSQLLQILFFAIIAVLPSAALIVALSRVRSGGIGAATRRIDRFLSYGRVAGRVLTLVVGVALVVLAVVRVVQLTGVLS
ncbi:hypothetical protein [Dietzia sp. ANT_WB102]|uniref:hypothetical protein n=1 Tax=Dietzia sp. ANT_WB102 TaxID=2597345 RepID=UPI0011EBBB41|nr:hypothetical protein [Dietzia sp. ANT_WB102]KAA0918624.1 hypothetical protein FQ137_04650 [Dietzia sp. ANT_WB102]